MTASPTLSVLAPSLSSASDSSSPPSLALTEVSSRTRDFGFLPIPRYLRHEPGVEAPFGTWHNIAFAILATFTVANLYYCQPILPNLAISFGVAEEDTWIIPTLVQAGYASGLLLITPLGDLIPRRPLILFLVVCSTLMTCGLAVTRSLHVFAALSFIVGVVSVVPQVLIPLVADLAAPHRRAGAIGIIWGAVMLGIMLARLLSGVVAGTSALGERGVYWMAAGLQVGMILGAWAIVPDIPVKDTGVSYAQILVDMGKVVIHEPAVVQASLGAILNNMAFANYWTTLAFLLKGAPFQYSDLNIGLFSLLGIAGVILGPCVTRVLERMRIPSWHVALFTSLAMLPIHAVLVGLAGHSIAASVVGALGTDVFRQIFQVSAASLVLVHAPEGTRSRRNAVLSVAYFVGQVVGSSASQAVWFSSGWRVAYALGLGWTGAQVLVVLARGPWVGRQCWVGWEGRWGLARAEAGSDVERAAEKNTQDTQSNGAGR